MSVFPDRIQWEVKYYINLTFPGCSNIIQCTLCKATESVIIPDFIDHLREIHNIIEITHHPDYNFLLRNFEICDKEFTAKCITCKSSINYKMYGVYLLKNHLEIYHGNSSDIYKTIVKTESGRDTLDKYFILGSKATCTKCYRNINMTDSELFTERKLEEELLEHYFFHSLIPEHIQRECNENVRKELKIEKYNLLRYLLKKQGEYLKKEDELLRRRTSILNEIIKSGKTVLNEPGPSTSSSTADSSEHSEQSGVPQNIATKRLKSSTLDETQPKQKKDE